MLEFYLRHSVGIRFDLLFARALEVCVLMRVKSADDGISTAVVLCLQSGKARGQTPQQRGTYLLRRRCKDAWIRLLAVAAIAGVRRVVFIVCA